MFGLGPTELILIFAIAILLFGPAAIRRLTKGISGALMEGRKSISEIKKSLEEK